MMLLHVLAVGAASLLPSQLLSNENSRQLSNEHSRLQSIQRASRDGMVTTDFEDAAIESIGGPFASTYGELTPHGFSALGRELGLGASDEFADLGSGLGRVVMQAAQEFSTRRAVGVEYAASRHRLALRKLQQQPGNLPVKLIQADCADGTIWKSCLSTCTVIYVSNLLFDADLNARLKSCIESAGCLRSVASLKPWPDGLRGFRGPSEVRCETSWSAPLLVVDAAGEAESHQGSLVYIYERCSAREA